MPTKIKVGGCQLGDCKRRKGDYCYAECGNRSRCRDACQNNPQKCGCYIQYSKGEK